MKLVIAKFPREPIIKLTREFKSITLEKSKKNSRDGSHRASVCALVLDLSFPVSSVVKHLNLIFESSPTTTDF